jgi:hypothetical protein
LAPVENQGTNTYPKAAGFASLLVPSTIDGKFHPNRNAKSLRNAWVSRVVSPENHPLDSAKTLIFFEAKKDKEFSAEYLAEWS